MEVIVMNTKQTNAKAFLERELEECPYRHEVGTDGYGNCYVRLSVNPDKTSIDADVSIRFLERIFVGKPYVSMSVYTFSGDKTKARELAVLITFATDLISRYELTDFS